MENNVRLHTGPQGPHLLINKKTVSNLRAFQLTTTPVLLTTWQWAGNGPKYTQPPDDIFSNEAYPLRIDIGQDVNQVNIILLSRPLGGLTQIDIDLHPDRKDLIRFAFSRPIPIDVVDTLLYLGVEVDIPQEPRS